MVKEAERISLCNTHTRRNWPIQRRDGRVTGLYMLDLTVLAILNEGAWQIKDGYTFFGIPPPIERWIYYLPITF